MTIKYKYPDIDPKYIIYEKDKNGVLRRRGYYHKCIICGEPVAKKGHRCEKCAYNIREKQKQGIEQYYKPNGKKGGYQVNRCACGNLKMIQSKVCLKCYRNRNKGKLINSCGYREINTKKDGWILEHRAIAEKVLDRKLKPNEVVHHINLNRKDNRNSNLLICKNTYHSWLHKQYAKRYAELFFD